MYSSDASTVGLWTNIDKTFATWKSTTTGDANSKNNAVNFVNSNNDLHLALSGNCALDGAATPVATNVDFDNQSRSLTLPDIGCDEFSPACAVTLNLTVLLEGFFISVGSMIAVLDPVNQPTVCDSIKVELHDANAPNDLAFSKAGIIDIHGKGQFVFPAAVLNTAYFIVVKHRNTLETWSKLAVLFDAQQKSFDFTIP